jgi:uncharacterized protein (DUF1778 family)
MTPEQQKLIDAAAKLHYEHLHLWSLHNNLKWAKWEDLTQEQRERHYHSVIGPVTVALKAAEQLIRENTIVVYGGQNYYRQKRTDGDSASLEYANAIASLIPQAPLGSEFEAVWDANTDKLYEP